LNSCLQLLLTAFDASSSIPDFNSDLGLQLQILHVSDITKPLDPSHIKKMLVDADDSRIELQKHYYRQSVEDPCELRRRLRNVEELRLNLGNGQQCVRDFLVCLTENKESWLDVYTFLNYNVQDTRRCKTCGNVSVNEVREEIYTEISCPADGSELSEAVEEFFNNGEIVEYHCEQGCGSRGTAEKRSSLQNVKNTKFIIIILRRTELHRGQAVVNTNDVSALQTINLKDMENDEATFEPISVVQHQGILRRDGTSSGHYTADVKNAASARTYRVPCNVSLYSF
jgi:hypothetical protein